MPDLKVLKGKAKPKMTKDEARAIMLSLREGPKANIEYLTGEKNTLKNEIGSPKYMDVMNTIEVTQTILKAFDFVLNALDCYEDDKED